MILVEYECVECCARQVFNDLDDLFAALLDEYDRRLESADVDGHKLSAITHFNYICYDLNRLKPGRWKHHYHIRVYPPEEIKWDDDPDWWSDVESVVLLPTAIPLYAVVVQA